MRSISGFNNSSLDGSFSAGQPISAAALNKLGTGVDITRTMMSNDVQFVSNTGGVSYSLPQQVYYSATGNPLDPSLNGDKVTIQPGTVNRYIPKIGANYIDETPRPTITVTDNGYILVKCTYEANKFFPRTAEIVFLAVPTPPADTDTESYYPLGRVTKTVVDSVTTYSLQIFQNGNLAVNRLKAGANIATWWWTRV
jgi:hypothetical protein